jgi:hypothetical protein
LTQTEVTATIVDQQGQLVAKLALDTNATGVTLGSQLPEGTYLLTLSSTDLFDSQVQPFQSQCQLIIDRSAPTLRSSLDTWPFYDEASGMRQVAPSSTIRFELTDASSSQVMVCLKPMGETCQDIDFQSVRNGLTAPQNGIWQLWSYAIDQAGNQTALQKERFAIFHQDQIDQILALLAESARSLQVDQQPEAWAAFQQANGLRRRLQLDRERDAVHWQTIQSFWQLDAQLTYLQSLNYGPDLLGTLYSPYDDRAIVKRNDGTTSLYRGAQLAGILPPNKQIAFNRDSSLWMVGNDDRVRLIDEQKGTIDLGLTGPKASLRIGSTGRWAVTWFPSDATRRNERRIQIWDASKPGAPVFERDISRVPNVPFGPFLFFDNDRYLLGAYGQEMAIWDLAADFKESRMTVDPGCYISHVVVRAERFIYLASRALDSQQRPFDEQLCDLLEINREDSTRAPRSLRAFFKIPSSLRVTDLALSNDSEQRYLILAAEVAVSSADPLAPGGTRLESIKLFDLLKDQTLPGFNSGLTHSLTALGTSSLRFGASSQQNGRQAYQISPATASVVPYMRLGRDSQEYFCRSIAERDLLACEIVGSKVQYFHTTDRTRRLQPFVSFDDSAPHPSDRPLAASVFDHETESGLSVGYDPYHRILELKSERGTVLRQRTADSHVLDLDIGSDGDVVVSMIDGSVAYWSAEGTFLRLPGEGLGYVLDIAIGEDGRFFALHETNEGKLILRSYRADKGSLETSTEQALPAIASDSPTLRYSPRAQQGLVYSSEVCALSEPREAIVFDREGRIQARLTMDNSDLRWDADGLHFLFSLGPRVYRYGPEGIHPVLDGLTWSPCEVFEGEEIYGRHREDDALYAVPSRRKIAESALFFALGPHGTILAAGQDSQAQVQVIAPRTSQILASFSIPTTGQLQAFYSSSDGDKFAVLSEEVNLGFALRRFTTDLNTMDSWLSEWRL